MVAGSVYEVAGVACPVGQMFKPLRGEKLQRRISGPTRRDDQGLKVAGERLAVVVAVELEGAGLLSTWL